MARPQRHRLGTGDQRTEGHVESNNLIIIDEIGGRRGERGGQGVEGKKRQRKKGKRLGKNHKGKEDNRTGRGKWGERDWEGIT